MTNSPAPAPQNQPAHEVRLGVVKAAIWQNKVENGVRYNVTFERLYVQDGDWRSSSSFGRDDLLLLAKVADEAHSWILTSGAGASGASVPQASGDAPTDLDGKSLPKRPAPAKART